ncbi:unnamed protein product [Ectocarpus sp. 13 AM-2016]
MKYPRVLHYKKQAVVFGGPKNKLLPTTPFCDVSNTLNKAERPKRCPLTITFCDCQSLFLVRKTPSWSPWSAMDALQIYRTPICIDSRPNRGVMSTCLQNISCPNRQIENHEGSRTL